MQRTNYFIERISNKEDGNKIQLPQQAASAAPKLSFVIHFIKEFYKLNDIPAQLVACLNQDETLKPAVIAFDMMYISDVDEATDAQFAKVCAEGGNAITAVICIILTF